jgi:hypothetical protein
VKMGFSGPNLWVGTLNWWLWCGSPTIAKPKMGSEGTAQPEKRLNGPLDALYGCPRKKRERTHDRTKETGAHLKDR